jgi:predicted permease
MSDLSDHAAPNWRWTEEVRSRLSSLSLSPTREAEIVDELSQHLEDRWQELVAGGASADEATRLTLAEFRGKDVLARYLAPLRQANVKPPIASGAPGNGILSDVGQDVRYAIRMLRKQPGFTLAALLTLALGIGANTAIFSLVDAVLFQRLPVQNRDRLFYLYRDANGAAPSLSYPAYAALRDNSRLVAGLVAWGGITASLNADAETEMVAGAIVSGRFFDTLGVTALLGRLLTAADDVTPGAHPVAVISHRLWRQRFAERPDIVGHEVRLNGQPFTIVGVTRADFPGAEIGAFNDLYVPMMMQPLMRPPRAGFSGEMNPDLLSNRNNGWLSVLALLEPGVSREQAQAEMIALAEADRAAHPRPGPAPTAVLVSIDAGNPAERRQLISVAQLLFGVVALVLLIACANVANLLLSKAVSRRREVALRLALGAQRTRIVRQLLTESLLLALLGGAGGVLLAVGVMQLFQAMPPPQSALPIALNPSLDGRVLLFALALTVLTGIAFGVAPALQSSRPGLVPALKDDVVGSDRLGRRFSLNKTLVVAEVALSVVLLTGAGLFIRSLRAIQAVEPGLAVSELISAPININLLRYTKVQGQQFYRQLVERIEELPGVSSASVARIALLAGGGSRVAGVRIEGRPYPPPGSSATPGPVIGRNATFANVVGPRFFTTVGVPLIAGRDFAAHDLENGQLVAIVNETMAQQFFPGEDPIGKRFATGAANASGEWTEVVGIARDSKSGDLSEGKVPLVYMPLSQRHESGVTLYVRSTLPASALIPQVRREIQRLEPHLPVPTIQAMEATIATRLYPQRMGANLLALFGGLAVLLASLGVYGVLAFSISRRRQELGVRIAVGADRRQIFTLVIREGLVLVALGLGCGLVASANLTGLIASFLFGIDPRDALTFALVPAVLTLVALVACYLPARRATQVNPVTALRSE